VFPEDLNQQQSSIKERQMNKFDLPFKAPQLQGPATSACVGREVAPMRKPGRMLRAAQRGLSMVELALVLIVASLILAAAFYGFSQQQRQVEVQENQAAISKIVSTLQSMYGKTGTYGDVTTAIAIQARAIPPNLRIGTGNTAQNSYGGSVTVAPVNCVTTNDCMTLTWAGVPSAQCAELVLGTQSFVRRVVIGTTTIKALDGVLNQATLATTCDGALNLDLIFTFGRGA
jgi:type II secretory pathway pseudopilin PulG